MRNFVKVLLLGTVLMGASSVWCATTPTFTSTDDGFKMKFGAITEDFVYDSASKTWKITHDGHNLGSGAADNVLRDLNYRPDLRDAIKTQMTTHATKVSNPATKLPKADPKLAVDDLVDTPPATPAAPQSPAVQKPANPPEARMTPGDIYPAGHPNPLGAGDQPPTAPAAPATRNPNANTAAKPLGVPGPDDIKDPLEEDLLSDNLVDPVPEGGVGGTEGGPVKTAGTPDTNKPEQQQANVQEVHTFNPVELVLSILATEKANQKLSVQKDINIKAGEIGEEVAPVDSSALSTDEGSGTATVSVLGAATAVKNLLTNATVDLNLLSEDVSFDKPTTPTTVTVTGADVGGHSSSVGNEGGQQPPAQDDKDDDDEDDTKQKMSEAARKELERRRAELLKQYSNAGIQIAEGMNAISHEFPDRTNTLLSKLEPGSTTTGDSKVDDEVATALKAFAGQSSIRTEPQAFALVQDVGRFALFETLRGVALSSVQMGVQASRLLFEQEVADETVGN